MSIFHEEWWLDTVSGGEWDEARVDHDDGTLAGRWPFVLRRGPGPLIRLSSPPLCPRLGPLINPAIDRDDLGAWSQTLVDLADQLPPHHHLAQNFDPAIRYWTPLSWRGFTQTTFFSFVIDDTADLDAVRSRYSQGTRRNYRKGERTLDVRDGQPVGPLHDALAATLRSAGIRVGFSASTLTRAVRESTSRDRGVHLSAHTQDGQYVAGSFFVWDGRTVYYLLGAATAAARGTGAQTLLLDRGIEIASNRGLRFDFEGSRVESIEQFFRTFGAMPEPYLHIERRTSAVDVLLSIRDAVRGRRLRSR